MKRFLIFFSLLWSICLSAGAQATSFTDLKFGQYQIADSQWNTSACLTTTTCQIYSTQPGTMYNIPWWNGQWSWQSGQYVKFSLTNDAANPYEGKVYNSDSTLAGTIGTGHIINMGVDANGKAMFFFVGNDNDTGQLFSTNAGLTGTSGYTWTGTLNPTTTQVNNFATSYGSTTPLSSGQTYTAAATPTPQPTPIYYNNANVKIINIWPTSSNSPPGEGATNAFDNNPNTKYLNFDKQNAGVTVQLNQGRVVNGFTITTANDFSGRDPTSYKLYGSNDGVTWVLIQEGSLSLSNNRFTTSSMVNITNSAAYAYYYIMFPTTKAGNAPAGCTGTCALDYNSMQIAEITFYYDANNTTTSTASGGGSAPVDPVQAASGPSVEGGTITQSNASTSQTLGSGSTYIAPTDSSDKQTRINDWNNGSQAHNNELYIDQIGNSNSVTITQTGTRNKIDMTISGNGNGINLEQTGSNYLKIDVPGWGNAITTTQSNVSGLNYAETKIQGNGNTVNHTQTGNHILFSKITGDINTVTATQAGSAGHTADVTLTGNFNSALVDQWGNTANKANINLSNVGGAASVDVQQSGGKSFTIIQGCANAAGCTTTIRQ